MKERDTGRRGALSDFTFCKERRDCDAKTSKLQPVLGGVLSEREAQIWAESLRSQQAHIILHLTRKRLFNGCSDLINSSVSLAANDLLH